MIVVDAESTCHPFFEASDAGNNAPIGPGAFPAPMCNKSVRVTRGDVAWINCCLASDFLGLSTATTSPPR
jgi:hypothetical protein